MSRASRLNRALATITAVLAVTATTLRADAHHVPLLLDLAVGVCGVITGAQHLPTPGA